LGENINLKRIHILNVPIDILPEEDFEDTIRDLLADKGQHQIIFLSFDAFLKARGNNEFARTVQQASLVIPTSKRIVKAAKFLKLPRPVRYMPFNFVIKLLGTLEKTRNTLYIAGMKPAGINIVSTNLRDSFPGLRIVGRCAGFFKADAEKDIILAIKKAAPSLLLGGNGIPGKDRWFYRNMKEFSSGLFLWCNDCFDIFLGKKQKISNEKWEGKSYWFFKAVKTPWKFWKVFRYMIYLIRLLVERIKKKP